MADLVYPPVLLLARTAFAGLGLRFVASGGRNLPRSGGGVLVSNHVSYLDFIFCGLAARPSGRLVRFMAKDAVFHHAVSGPLMRGMHHIPVDREAGAAAYADAVRALRAGEIVGVFPEATISRSFELKEFKTGAARMAAAADVPLIPMATWGGQRMFTKSRPRDFSRGTAIGISVGEAFGPDAGADPVATTVELKRRVGELLTDLQARYPQHPKDDDDRWWVPARLGGTAPTLEEATAMDAAEAIERAQRRPASEA